MRKLLTVLAATLALSVSAEAASTQYPAKAHPPKESHRHSAWQTAAPGGDADCPNRDCRGINSPGNLGGHHEF